MAEKFTVAASAKTPKIKTETNSKQARLKATNALVKGVHLGALKIQSYLPTLLNNALEANVWKWPRPTRRQNGSVAGTTRNIVDTGELRDSLDVSVKFMKNKTNFLIKYGAPHAALVHHGGYVAPYGRTDLPARFIPGRPWISAVLDGGYSGVDSLDIQSEMLISLRGVW